MLTMLYTIIRIFSVLASSALAYRILLARPSTSVEEAGLVPKWFEVIRLEHSDPSIFTFKALNVMFIIYCALALLINVVFAGVSDSWLGGLGGERDPKFMSLNCLEIYRELSVEKKRKKTGKAEYAFNFTFMVCASVTYLIIDLLYSIPNVFTNNYVSLSMRRRVGDHRTTFSRQDEEYIDRETKLTLQPLASVGLVSAVSDRFYLLGRQIVTCNVRGGNGETGIRKDFERWVADLEPKATRVYGAITTLYVSTIAAWALELELSYSLPGYDPAYYVRVSLSLAIAVTSYNYFSARDDIDIVRACRAAFNREKYTQERYWQKLVTGDDGSGGGEHSSPL